MKVTVSAEKDTLFGPKKGKTSKLTPQPQEVGKQRLYCELEEGINKDILKRIQKAQDHHAAGIELIEIPPKDLVEINVKKLKLSQDYREWHYDVIYKFKFMTKAKIKEKKLLEMAAAKTPTKKQEIQKGISSQKKILKDTYKSIEKLTTSLLSKTFLWQTVISEYKRRKKRSPASIKKVQWPVSKDLYNYTVYFNPTGYSILSNGELTHIMNIKEKSVGSVKIPTQFKVKSKNLGTKNEVAFSFKLKNCKPL